MIFKVLEKCPKCPGILMITVLGRNYCKYVERGLPCFAGAVRTALSYSLAIS
jgi:hypothetical protein